MFMIRFCAAFVFAFLLGIFSVWSQVSPDCANAVPICNNTPVNGGTDGLGIDDFNGSSVSGCIAQGSGTIESNSAWYRFRTGESGQLGFNIGFDIAEDWDFALYRTNDCNNLGEPIRCNYFDNSDNNTYIGVGADPTGASNFQYDDWLQVESGEDYYLFINNFSNVNSGFSIQFSGNIFIEFPNSALDCSIINNLLGPPIAACDADNVILDATTGDAISYEWYLDLGFGYQQIPVESDATLSVVVSAMYRVLVVVPSGANIISEVQVAFSPSPITNPLSDETVCLDDTLFDLSQKDAEALGMQSPDDFRVSYHTSMADAVNGSNNLPTNFQPNLTTQTIYVRTTSIENASCFDASEAFIMNGVVLPDLNFSTLVYVCEDSPVATIGQLVSEPDYSYSWNTGETTSQITVAQEGTYTLSATNSEGSVSCVSVRSVDVIFSRPPAIRSVAIEYMDDTNVVTVLTESEGDFLFQLDGETPQTASVFEDVFPGAHTVTVIDINGCGEDTEEIVVVGFPKFFTPNGDGTNDVWNVQGLSVLENPIVTVYDRFGKFLKQIDQNSEGWNGTYNGVLLPESDYWFKLSYTATTGETITAKYINNHFSLKR